MREDWDRLFGAPAAHRMIRPDIIGGVPVAWIGGEGASAERVFIYLHGGGYQSGSPRSHADLVARISASSGATGLVVAYRLEPEHRFTAPTEDGVAGRSAAEARGELGTNPCCRASDLRNPTRTVTPAMDR